MAVTGLRRFLALCLIVLVALGCGGGGGSSLGSLTLTADFADPTRVVPGYADSLRVTVAPPAGVTLPAGVSNPFVLTRGSTSRTIKGLTPSTSSYVLLLEAMTNSVVVGTAQRSVIVAAGQEQDIDVSANLQSQIASIAIEGATSATVGNNVQYTAHARNSQGQTLFSGAGFAWTSTHPLVLFIDPDTGLAVPRGPGETTVRATLKGTALTTTLSVEVSEGGDLTVSVSPTGTVVFTSAPRQFAATVTGHSNTSVTWTVDEPGGGAVTSGGLYTAPPTTGVFTVRATSVADPSVSATATVVVQSPEAWTVTNLHPASATESEARGVDGSGQAGVAFVGAWRASAWNGTAASWVDLHPSGATSSFAWDVSGGVQVGLATIDGQERACLWNGSAATWTDIHPSTSTGDSAAFGADDGTQIGAANIGGQDHAGLWSGSSASWVDLHPVGASASIARDSHNGQQVGYAFHGAFQAALWTGTPGSWVSLKPEEVGDAGSFALAVHNGQQVGYASVSTVGPHLHASLWAGTAASWVDLHPIGASDSVARGVHSGTQVGYTIVGGKRRAAVWRGSFTTWVDLHVYVPSRFSESHAESVWTDAGGTRVVGWGRDSSTNRTEALMWVLAP